MKITYLLGAGASAEALPLIKSNKKDNIEHKDSEKGLPESLQDFLNQYEKEWTVKTINGETGPDHGMLETFRKLNDIAANCLKFGTPDLFAKFLYEKNPRDNESYLLLKTLISNYFTLKQYSDSIGRGLGHRSFDQRSLVFLSTISEDGKLPQNVKIVSWNYDEQLEIAARKLNSNDENYLTSWPNQNVDYKGDYFLLHLNGVAGWDYKNFAQELPKEFSTYKNFHFSRNPLLSFAWEKKENHNYNIFFDQRLEVLEKMVAGTEILVIIGYSFPFFNRKIDEKIFRLLDEKVQIFYQDPNAENKISLIKKLFKISNTIEPITYTEQYFVPFEL